MIEVLIKHFNYSEFDSKDLPGSGKSMNLGTLLKLDYMRERRGKAIKPNSGVRTKVRNKAVGGKADSSHLYGFAADLDCKTTDELMELLELAWEAGFRRFGIMNGALHVDDDPTKPPKVMWGYGNESTTRFTTAKHWFAGKLKEGKF